MPSVAPLRLIRSMIGLALILQAIETSVTLHHILQPGKLRTPFFDWFPMLPTSTLPVFGAIWIAAAIAFMLGYRIRLAGVMLVVVMAYGLLCDQQNYSNHVYLLVIVVLVLLLPADLATRALRWQMTAVYAFGAISKVNLIFISGAVLAANLRDGWLVPLPDALVRWEVMLPLALGAILMDGFLAVALWVPKYRLPGLITGLTFHALIVLLFPAFVTLELIVFALTMWAMYCAFVDPSHVWQLIAERLRAGPIGRPALQRR